MKFDGETKLLIKMAIKSFYTRIATKRARVICFLFFFAAVAEAEQLH